MPKVLIAMIRITTRRTLIFLFCFPVSMSSLLLLCHIQMQRHAHILLNFSAVCICNTIKKCNIFCLLWYKEKTYPACAPDPMKSYGLID